MNTSTENDSDRIAERYPRARIPQIGNYPPLIEEIRRRENGCQVLNLNERPRRGAGS